MIFILRVTLTQFILIILISIVFTFTGLTAMAESIIADHRAVHQFEDIPVAWLEKAKQLKIHYAHTSHGSQINSGLLELESTDSRYSIAIRTSSSAGLPPDEDPPALRMYDGNPPETYIEPGDYWDGTSAIERTRAVANTGDYNFSMWSWCGQQSSNTEATTQRYIDTMAQFETEFPSMRFIYMTGHTDGSGEDGNLNQRNNQIREYCRANDKVLFDFADIESYDPSGNYYLDKGANDKCEYQDNGVTKNWADEWCDAYPGECSSCSCAHSKSLNCDMKAKAFWWMMARLASWNPDEDDGKGDVNGDGLVDMSDIILSLQVAAEIQAVVDIELKGDVNGDGRISIAEAIYVLRKIAE